jgi:hypothetical protein
MDSVLDLILSGDAGGGWPDPLSLLLVVLLAFISGQIIGWVYMWTHLALSYSRLFVSSLVVIPVIVALVLVLMAGNIVIAFGLLAVFAVVRFRNVLKDTRDTVFVLWAISVGMAVGTMHYSTAILACLSVAAIFLYLRFTLFGTRRRYDVILTLRWEGPEPTGAALKEVLKRHSVRSHLASQRGADAQGLDLSYRLLLRDPERRGELLADLHGISQVTQASLYLAEDESEI